MFEHPTQFWRSSDQSSAADCSTTGGAIGSDANGAIGADANGSVGPYVGPYIDGRTSTSFFPISSRAGALHGVSFVTDLTGVRDV